jgi:hypothetical protein
MDLLSALRRFTALSMFLLLPVAWAAETTVRIYNTGDLHAHTGNLSRIAAYVKARRAENPNVLLVDAGDVFNKGDLPVMVTEGEAMFDLLAASGYDACILGNHGLSHGSARSAQLIDRFRFPLVDANSVWPEGMRPKISRPYRLFKMAGVNVAVIGTCSEHMNHRPDSVVKRKRIPDALRELLPKVREEADIVVLLTHAGSRRDRQVATELAKIVPNGVDLIVGAHDHSRYEKLNFDEASQTVIMHSGDFGRWLGEVVFTWDGEKITKRTSRLIPIKADMPRDPAVQARHQAYVDAFPETESMAQVEQAMPREAVTEWIAGMVRRQTGAHAVLAPIQLARGGLPVGPVTGRKLLQTVPCFDVIEFTVPDAAALARLAEDMQKRRVEALCAAARKRKGDGEKWAADMLRVVGKAPAGPAPERTAAERKAFGKIRGGLVLSPGPLKLFATAELPAGPLRVAYPCTRHDAMCQPTWRGFTDQQLERGQSLWRLVRADLARAAGAELPVVTAAR